MNRTISTFVLRGAAIVAALVATGCSHVRPPLMPDPAYGPVVTSQAEQQQAAERMAQTGSIYSNGHAIELFRDTRAYRVGDTLTVLLQEKTAAKTTAETSTKKDDSLELGAPTIFGRGVTDAGKAILGANSEASRSFKGSGNSSQSNSLDGEITVMVARVLPNGNLAVRGEKILTINQGAEFVRLRGIIRPQDVRPDNTVYSSRIANAQVSYGGDSALSDANEAGWASRFFNSKYWPF